jgi:hypothetical protein
MGGFYEKVGELGVDMTLNVDKKQQSKVNNLIAGVKNKVGSLGSAFSGLGAKLSIAGVIAGITGGIMAMNHKLQDTIDYWDKLQTQADSLRITIEDIQKLKLATELGDIPNFDAFAKNLMNMRKSLSELQRGEDTEGAGYLKQIGLTGKEDIITAMKSVLKSFKLSDKNVVEGAIRTLFGKIDSENYQFLSGGGFEAFEKVEKVYSKRQKEGKTLAISSKKSGEIGAIDEEIKVSEHFRKIEKANKLNVSDAMRSYEASKAVADAMDDLITKLSPVIGEASKSVTSLANKISDFMNKIPTFITQLENTFKKLAKGDFSGVFNAMWGKNK